MLRDRNGEGVYDFSGASAIHWAAYHGRLSAVMILIDHGADVMQKDSVRGCSIDICGSAKFDLAAVQHRLCNCKLAEACGVRVDVLLAERSDSVPRGDVLQGGR